MAIIKICNHYLSTNYKGEEAKDKFEEQLKSYIEDMDTDAGFDLDFFLEDLIENNHEFEFLSDIDSDDPDIEYTEENVDDLVEDTLATYHDEENYSTDFDASDEVDLTGEDEND